MRVSPQEVTVRTESTMERKRRLPRIDVHFHHLAFSFLRVFSYYSALRFAIIECRAEEITFFEVNELVRVGMENCYILPVLLIFFYIEHKLTVCVSFAKATPYQKLHRSPRIAYRKPRSISKIAAMPVVFKTSPLH